MLDTLPMPRGLVISFGFETCLLAVNQLAECHAFGHHGDSYLGII